MICPHCNKYFVRVSRLEGVTPSEAARFWKRIKKTEDDGCWLFTGRLDCGGYGRMKVGGRQFFAHVISWVLHNGPLPPDKIVAHSCDNPTCARPSHLEAKTQKQNMQDMVARGRDGREKRRGEKCVTSKLTDAQTAEIIASLSNKTETIRQLSKRFGVTFNCIYGIGLGRRSGVPPVIMAKQKRLPDSAVLKIRGLLASGLSHTKTARIIGCSRTAVTKIANGVTHRHVPMPLKEAA